jgi:transposase
VQLERRLVNISRCLIGMEACSGAHHIGRQLGALGHDVRLIPAQYVKPFLKGHKNDYRDAEAIAEAVQRPTMRFAAIKTPEQMDLLALHRVRSRLIRQCTGVINQSGDSSSSAALQSGKGRRPYPRRCLIFWDPAQGLSHHGWFASLLTWPRTGAD